MTAGKVYKTVMYILNYFIMSNHYFNLNASAEYFKAMETLITTHIDDDDLGWGFINSTEGKILDTIKMNLMSIEGQVEALERARLIKDGTLVTTNNIARNIQREINLNASPVKVLTID